MEAINGLIKKALKVFTPPPKLTVTEWADTYRHLSDNSAEPGRFDSSRAPFQREIMNALNDPNVEEIWAMCSAQVGKTEILLNILGYHIHFDPCPILFVQPTEGLAEDFSKERISMMFRDTPVLSKIMNDKSTSDSVLNKIFPGGSLGLAGANAPSGLASKPRRLVLLDEVDRFPASAGKEGDPVNLAKKRTTTFLNRKIVAVSTPTIKETSRILRGFNSGDQRRYHVPCPHCGEFQSLKFVQLNWEGIDVQDTKYKCEFCFEMISHSEKSEMLTKGKWIKENPAAKKIASFHLSELYSPWKSWGDVASEYLKTKNNPEEYKVFLNTSLGEVYEHSGDAPEWRRLYDRREKYKTNTLPKGAYFITCGVDVQRNRFEYEVIAWGLNKESWSLDFRIIPAETSRLESFSVIDDLLQETWSNGDGMEMPIYKLAIDSGDQTQTVYAWSRKHQKSRVLVVKGGHEDVKVAISTPSYVDLDYNGQKAKNGIQLWTVGTWTLKRELYGLLKIQKPTDEELEEVGMPFGFCHFPEYDEKYFRGLCSEVEETKLVNGFPRYYWRKVYERNEPLDCRIYGRAAAEAAGISRLKEADLKKLSGLVAKMKIRN